MIFAARWRTPSLVRQGMIRQLKPLPWPAPASLFWLPPKNDTAGVLPGGRDTVQALTLRGIPWLQSISAGTLGISIIGTPTDASGEAWAKSQRRKIGREAGRGRGRQSG